MHSELQPPLLKTLFTTTPIITGTINTTTTTGTTNVGNVITSVVIFIIIIPIKL